MAVDEPDPSVADPDEVTSPADGEESIDESKASTTIDSLMRAVGKAPAVDVREPAEWAEAGVAAPAVLLPKSDFDGARKLWAPFLEKNAGKQIILYCRSGRRADTVAQALAAEGRSAANAGGLKDWQAAGLPTRPAKP